MKELLKQWAEFEPGVCQAHYVENQYIIKIGSADKEVQSVDTNLLELAWLQLAIQRATEARGWDYELTCLEGEKLYLASIPKNYWREDKDSVYQAGWSDGPFASLAEAFLSAYLKELGAVTKKG